MRLVAIDRDGLEARVVADRQGANVTVNKAFVVRLEEAADEEAIRDALAEGLKNHGVGRSDALLTVERSDAELRTLKLPHAPDAELPPLVRFQGLREFSQLTESAPLDFYRMDELSDDESVTVLAAAVSSDLVKQFKAVCDAAELRPNRLILRPCAAARLADELTDTKGTVQLLVDVLGDHANLTVVIADMVVFTRSVRLSTQVGVFELQSKTFISEVRRTLAASHNQLEGSRVEQILVWGLEESLGKLADSLRTALDMPVVQKDPFEAVRVDHKLAQDMPASPGRFAAALGLLLSADGGPHILDFLNPRKEEGPPDYRRTYMIAGAAAASVLLLIVAGFWFYLHTLDNEIAAKQNRSNELEQNVTAAKKTIEELNELDAWAGQGANWLEEIKNLSEKLPPPEEMQLSRFHAIAQRAGGRIILKGTVKTRDAVTLTEQNVRDERHLVASKTVGPNPQGGRYPLQFDEIKIELNNRPTAGSKEKKKEAK